ncbi:MAG: endospore germination permease [Vulcanibacillus sp.]
MLENGKISRFQLWLLLINFLIGSAIIFIPSSIISTSKQDAWLSMLLLIFIGSFFIVLVSTLSKLHFGKTIVAINTEVFGKIIGLVVNIFYVWFFILLSAILLREIADIMKVITLNDTPLLVINVLVSILVFYAAFYGLEVYARANEIFSLVAFIGFLLTILLVTPIMEIERLKPIFDEGFKTIIKGMIPAIGFTYGEMAVFFMVIPFVNNKKHLTKILLSSGLIAGLSLLLIVVTSILVLDVPESGASIFAPITLARLIRVGDFLSRVEIIFYFTFFSTLYIKLCLTFYAGVLAVSEVFKLSFYRPVIIPMLIIVISLSLLITDSIIEFLDFSSNSWLPFTLISSFVIPIILLILTLIKKKKTSS